MPQRTLAINVDISFNAEILLFPYVIKLTKQAVLPVEAVLVHM
jgi:hypothetical protein